MASSVATPLERPFGRIAGVTQMTSTSQLGATNITLQFDLDRDIDAASRDVQAAINAAAGQLPANLPSLPTYRKINPADAPILDLATDLGHDSAGAICTICAIPFWRRKFPRWMAWAWCASAAEQSPRCAWT